MAWLGSGVAEQRAEPDAASRLGRLTCRVRIRAPAAQLNARLLLKAEPPQDPRYPRIS